MFELASMRSTAGLRDPEDVRSGVPGSSCRAPFAWYDARGRVGLCLLMRHNRGLKIRARWWAIGGREPAKELSPPVSGHVQHLALGTRGLTS
jgi:hypothetical protein